MSGCGDQFRGCSERVNVASADVRPEPTRRALILAALAAGTCVATTRPLAAEDDDRPGSDLRPKAADLLVFYDRRTLSKVLELVRHVDPTLVFTHSPTDYMVDHEITSHLCQSACFGACAPNFRTGSRRPAKPVRGIPHLYYAQPFADKDILGREILPRIFVNITAPLERKEQMLACHESQRAWLKAQQEIPQVDEPLRKMARRAGKLSGFTWAEGYRQHLGQGFPQDDLLAKILGDLVRSERD